MARGRGRGRGRGRRTSVTDDCISIGTRIEEEDSQKKEQAQQEEAIYEAELTTSTKGARKLSLESQRAKEEERGNLDLEGFENEIQAVSNGTVTKSTENKDKDGNAETDQEQKKEPWVNMFKNNRVASNGMQLSYFPSQVVDGQAVVQLEEKEVQEEEQKWKCALIAYVIGECPGYNTMKRYIMLNWSSVSKPELFLHEDGYCLSSFRRLVI